MVERYASRDDAISEATSFVQSQLGETTDLYVSGGSSFTVFEALDKQLSEQQKQAINILQVDERYGAVGHPDSNWRRLDVVDLEAYHSARSLLEAATDPQAIAQTYSVAVSKSLDSTANKIAILGVGEDAHVAGVKPMDEEQYHEIFHGKLVTAYDWSDFSRITLTLDALRRFDAAVVFMSGSAKAAILDTFDEDRAEYESPIHGFLSMKNIKIVFTEE